MRSTLLQAEPTNCRSRLYLPVVTETFLLNGVILTATDEDCVITMLQLAAGEMDDNQFADWISANT